MPGNLPRGDRTGSLLARTRPRAWEFAQTGIGQRTAGVVLGMQNSRGRLGERGLRMCSPLGEQ